MGEILTSKRREPEAYVDPIVWYYNKARNRSETDENILQKDLTDDFWTALSERIQRGNLITISIRGETTSGKSTAGLTIKGKVNEFLRKVGKRKDKDIQKAEYETICSDQVEANRFFLKDYRNVCVLIDEFSALGQSDFNATTEQNLFQFHTDAEAQKYIHKIYCTPKSYSTYDTGATFLLDILGSDKVKGTTLCRLYYNDPTSSLTGGIALGTITLNVNDLIKNWRKIEITFRKEKKTKQEENLIKEWARKDYYIKYMIKKFSRLSLLDKYGVKDIRQLERSEVILECYKRLEYMAQGREIGVTRDVISGYVPTEVANILREKKLLTYSTIGRADVIQEINSILYGINVIAKIEKVLYKKNIMTEENQKQSIKTIKKMKEGNKKRLENLEKDVQILKEYYNIN